MATTSESQATADEAITTIATLVEGEDAEELPADRGQGDATKPDATENRTTAPHVGKSRMFHRHWSFWGCGWVWLWTAEVVIVVVVVVVVVVVKYMLLRLRAVSEWEQSGDDSHLEPVAD